MRTPDETLRFVTKLLINDLNMLTTELRYGMARTLDDTDIRLPVIEITFKDMSKSNWIDTLNKEMESYLKGQKFFISKCDKDSLIIAMW